MKRKYVLLIISALIIVSFITYANRHTNNVSHAINGVLDLESWNPSKDNYVSMNGTWEFYWKKFLKYNEINSVPSLLVNTPSTWIMYMNNGKHLPANGFGTYRLHVKTSLPAGTKLGIGIYYFSSAYSLYINDKFIASDGVVSDNEREEIVECRPKPVYFETPSREFDIIIHVSNFQYSRPGFIKSIQIGMKDNIEKDYIYQKINIGVTYGMLLIVALFSLSLTLYNNKHKHPLYFAILCIMIIPYYDSLTYVVILRKFSAGNILFIMYSLGAWIFFIITMYYYQIYKSKYSFCILLMVFLLTVFQQLVIFIVSPNNFSNVMNYNVLVSIYIFELIADFSILIYSIYKKKIDAWYNFAFLIITTIMVINYYLSYMVSFFFDELLFIGTFLILLLQTVLIVRYIRFSYQDKSDAEQKFLHLQIKLHFIFNALNTILSISRYDPESSRDLLMDLSTYLNLSFNLNNENQYSLLKEEIELVKVFINIEKARFEERIEVEYDLPENQDIFVPSYMLQPIVENAVIHGVLRNREGGRIKVRVTKRNKIVVFNVYDNGVGLQKEKIDKILNSDKTGHIGLSNINKRLLELNKKGLTITSEPGIGTVVSWEIKIKKDYRGSKCRTNTEYSWF